MTISADDLTDEQLLALDHNDHAGAFRGYLNNSSHSSDKQTFLRAWVAPVESDSILECGSSSGKTSIDFVRYSNCRCVGVDFDPEAIEIAKSNRDRFFPELANRCHFMEGDLTRLTFDESFNKVVMPDFTEHIPDRVFSAILRNIQSQLKDATLYLYTPNRTHIFEILKHRNLFLKNEGGHINVKSRRALERFLENNGWKIQSSTWRESSIPVFKHLERVAGWIPLIGRMFQRRVVITARAQSD